MDEQPQHVHIITMLPLHAAMPICSPPRAGQEQEIDFGAPLRPGLRHGIIL